MLGKPLLPWQRYVADVAGEIDPATGTYYYDRVVLSTPRQCGKSTLIDTEDTRNALLGPDRKIYYLAQTGKDAEKHFKDFVQQLSKSKLAPFALKPRLSNGGMEQRFGNGSFICPLAVTKVAGHGTQMDKFTIDEAFSLDDETGKLILDGMAPTMNTRLHFTGVQPQIWITSTEGTADSTFLNGLLDSFRAGNVPKRTCWFDFGIPDDADPEDFQTILKWHPAAGLLWDVRQLRDFRGRLGARLRQPARQRRGRARHPRPAVAIDVGHANHAGPDRRPTRGDSRGRRCGCHEHVDLGRDSQP
jgi:hypothetical protein